MEKHLKNFILILADNTMILGQRLSQWCGHGPILEQDIAITNIALDLIGEARNYYQYLAELEGMHEDDYPMKREVIDFKNCLLVEMENGHWGDTIMRQFMYDCFHFHLLKGLTESADQRLSAIAKKSVKEAKYHLEYSSDWVIRLGDGTEESHQKMQGSLDRCLPYFEELFMPNQDEKWCMGLGICPDLDLIKSNAFAKFNEIISIATLSKPDHYISKYGGKDGQHSAQLNEILVDLQFMQKAYPNAVW